MVKRDWHPGRQSEQQHEKGPLIDGTQPFSGTTACFILEDRDGGLDLLAPERQG
ncbi:hypothetical protein ACFXOY_09625 [Streptomyces niveus]|uniref:hypothetical protein n=1 Tax=Streptomyces niveus TaxID=193462 RepID=UPI0036B929E5